MAKTIQVVCGTTVYKRRVLNKVVNCRHGMIKDKRCCGVSAQGRVAAQAVGGERAFWIS